MSHVSSAIYITTVDRSMSSQGVSNTPVYTDRIMPGQAKLSFITSDGKRWFFSCIQLTVCIGNNKDSFNPIRGWTSFKHKGGKECIKRRAQKRARTQPKKNAATTDIQKGPPPNLPLTQKDKPPNLPPRQEEIPPKLPIRPPKPRVLPPTQVTEEKMEEKENKKEDQKEEKMEEKGDKKEKQKKEKQEDNNKEALIERVKHFLNNKENKVKLLKCHNHVNCLLNYIKLYTFSYFDFSYPYVKSQT